MKMPFGKRPFIEENLQRLGRRLGLDGILDGFQVFVEDSTLLSEVEAGVADEPHFRTKKWPDVLALAGLYRSALYCAAYALKAERVVETGVLHGLSSVFLLQPISLRTSAGRMISLDLPSYFDEGPANMDGYVDILPRGREPGWLVPERLRPHWTLKLGASRDLLQESVDELGSLDLFVHDSEHTHQTMTFEFETVWPSLRDGGVLIADNIDSNTSFFDFCQTVDRVPHVLPADPDHIAPGESGIRVGILRK